MEIPLGKNEKPFAKINPVQEVKVPPYKLGRVDEDYECRILLELVKIDKYRQTG